MKTIGYIVPSFPHLTETFVGNEIRAMQERGHTVVPIVFKRADGLAQPEDFMLVAGAHYLEDIPTKRATDELKRPSTQAAKALSFVWSQKTLPRYSLFGNALKIAAIAREHGCDHLHAHFANFVAAHAIIAARWSGATVSFVGHGIDVYKEPEDLELKLKSADIAIGLSQDMSEAFTAYNAQAQVAMVPCGINVERFLPASQRQADNGKLLFFGRLRHRKGIDDIIDAALRLGEKCPQIDIIGDGPLLDTLLKRTGEHQLLNKKITFLGSEPSGWIAMNAPNYKGIILPFKASLDGLRDTRFLALKEAMAMGRPVITTNLKEIRDIISPDEGLIVEPANPHQLAQAILKLMELDEQQSIQMTKAALSHVRRHFSLDAQARALSGLFEMISPQRQTDATWKVSSCAT